MTLAVLVKRFSPRSSAGGCFTFEFECETVSPSKDFGKKEKKGVLDVALSL